jgi:hypothetical protein
MGKKIEYDALLHALKGPALMTGAIAVSFSPAASAQSSCKGEFHAPADPMVLSRQVHRSLADGKDWWSRAIIASISGPIQKAI